MNQSPILYIMLIIIPVYFIGVIVGAIITRNFACEICEDKENKCISLPPLWEREAVKNGWKKP